MALPKVTFENFYFQFDLDCYSEDCANASWDDIQDWQERVMREHYAKFGISRSAEKGAFIASITVDGKGKDDPKRCTTAFGKSPLSAYQKLLYLVEYARWIDRDEGHVDSVMEEKQLEFKALIKKAAK